MPATNITLRLATRTDAEVIATMSRDLIEAGLAWSWTPERVARGIGNRDCVTLVACDAERVVAFAIMHFGDTRGRLNLLAVRARYQRTGIGRRLVAWLESSALVAGIEAVELELRRDNVPARRFYERLGFRPVGIVARYYGGTVDALRMARDIRRVAPVAPSWRAPWQR